MVAVGGAGLHPESAACLLAKQSSGLSATHEAYREAKDSRPVFAFRARRRESRCNQAAFLKEVQAWHSGLFREGFASADQLRALVTRRLHKWEIATMAGRKRG